MFRKDIAGLRALAVLAVVLYHFGVPGFSGGFVGVDVFFVISGFLMTEIVSRGLAQGSFSLWGFYKARAERIIPALAILCGVLAVVSLLFDPVTTQEIGTQVLSALTFTSNFLFWSQNSYFAAGADTKWLLHTWSLSVEWQFYIVFPIIVMLIWRINTLRGRLGWVMIAGTILSFATCAFFATRGAYSLKSSFFLLPFRAWEMLLGGVVACYPSLLARVRPFMVVLAGLALIFLSIFLFQPATPWPAWNAALPTLGTAVVLWGCGRSDRWSTLPGVQWLGAWSYSIYLWHWPLVVGLHHLPQGNAALFTAPGIVASVGMGATSYWLIETRLRKRLFTAGAGLAWTAAALGMGAPLALAATMHLTSGIEGIRSARLAPRTRAALVDYRLASTDRDRPDDCTGGRVAEGELEFCIIGNPAARDTVIIGDSHARQLAPRLATIFKDKPGGVTIISRGGCPVLPLVRLKMAGDTCDARNRAALDLALARSYKHVVIASFWSGYLEPRFIGGEFQQKFCFVDGPGCRSPSAPEAYLAKVDVAVNRLGEELIRFKQAGVRTTLVLAVPYDLRNASRDLYAATFAADRVVEPFAVPRDQLTGPQRRLRDHLVTMAQRTGTELVDPRETMCSGVMCPTFINGRTIYSDNNHLRASRSSLPQFDFIERLIAG